MAVDRYCADPLRNAGYRTTHDPTQPLTVAPPPAPLGGEFVRILEPERRPDEDEEELLLVLLGLDPD